MNYLEKFFDGVHYVFNLNAATLSGAIDILLLIIIINNHFHFYYYYDILMK